MSLIRIAHSDFESNRNVAFADMLLTEAYVDVTLACENHCIKAHKVVLSASSSYLHFLFQEHAKVGNSNAHFTHPIIVLKDIEWDVLSSLVMFMYRGEVEIPKEKLTTFLNHAKFLKINGLENYHQHNDPVRQKNKRFSKRSDLQRQSEGKKNIVKNKSTKRQKIESDVNKNENQTSKSDNESYQDFGLSPSAIVKTELAELEEIDPREGQVECEDESTKQPGTLNAKKSRASTTRSLRPSENADAKKSPKSKISVDSLTFSEFYKMPFMYQKHYDYIGEDEKLRPAWECHHCRTLLKMSGSSLYNAKRHLMKFHTQIFNEDPNFVSK